MKLTVISNDKGEVVATYKDQVRKDNFPDGLMAVGLMAGPNQILQEMEVPDEFSDIKSSEVLHARVKELRTNLRRDPIRVVPLYVPGRIKVAPAVPPKLTYRNGPILSAAQVVTVFWGAAWNQSPQSGYLNELNTFFDFILTSPLIDQLAAEYSIPGGPAISHGQRIGTITLTKPLLAQTVSDNAIQQMLQQEIRDTNVPQPNQNTLYFVYLSPGVKVVQGGGSSCQTFCGYHNDINSQVFYAVMPYPSCIGCSGGLDDFEALTLTSSHELCEAITDAIPGQGWYDDHNGEIGDICAWETKKVGDYIVQLEWSNSAGQCK